MNKLDPNPIAQTYVVQPAAHTACAHRLIVLVSPDIDSSAAAPRIWELAHAAGMDILLLSFCKNAAEEPGLRRGLVTMASLLQNGKTTVEAKVDIGKNWIDAIKTHYGPGDIIVCFAEQSTGILHRPLSQLLESNLKATVYILSGLTSQNPKPHTISQIGAWLGFLGIIVGFGILQAKTVQLQEDWFQSSLLILSIILELWLVWAWNRQFS